MKKKAITINNQEILILSGKNEDYISLTDMAKYKNPEATSLVISHWLSTRYTIEFMGLWEKIYNPFFNVTEFSDIRNESGSNGFVLSSKQWIEKTNAIGIISKAGRYHGGTFLDSINSLLVHQNMGQSERLMLLNETAITQMKSLVAHKNIKLLK